MTVETTPITPTTETGTDIETLQRALDDAQTTLKAFKEEAASIPEEIRAAAEDGGAAAARPARQGRNGRVGMIGPRAMRP